jgi:hypothetical protein
VKLAPGPLPHCVKQFYNLTCYTAYAAYVTCYTAHGLDDYRHALLVGWNKRVAKRREAVRHLVEDFGGKR